MICAIRRVSLIATILAVSAGIAAGQQAAVRPGATPSRLPAYSVGKEAVIEGVIQQYAGTGSVRIQLQTASGTKIADLGPAEYVAASHLSLKAGDAVKLTGVISATSQGTIFLARAIQKGGEVVLLRTAQGAPIGRAGTARLGVGQQHADGAR